MGPQATTAHWSFWLIGALALLFNLAGVANYLGQLNAEIVASMPAEYQDLILNRPLWVTAAFAVAVFGGAIASLLLLLKKALARPLFMLSLLGAAATLLHTLGLAGSAAAPAEATMGNAVQLLVCGFLAWYCTSAIRKGWIT